MENVRLLLYRVVFARNLEDPRCRIGYNIQICLFLHHSIEIVGRIHLCARYEPVNVKSCIVCDVGSILRHIMGDVVIIGWAEIKSGGFRLAEPGLVVVAAHIIDEPNSEVYIPYWLRHFDLIHVEGEIKRINGVCGCGVQSSVRNARMCCP